MKSRAAITRSTGAGSRERNQVWCTWVTRAPLPTVEHHSRSADGLPFEGDHRRPVQLQSIPGSPGYEAARSYDLLCDSGVSTRCIMRRLASSLHDRVCGYSSDPASGVRITGGGGDIIMGHPSVQLWSYSV